MAVSRRRLQFSLRLLLGVLTVFAVWLGGVVSRAREQREVVKVIEALGGTVRDEWQTERDIEAWLRNRKTKTYHGFDPDSSRPGWLRGLCQTVVEIYFFVVRVSDSEARESIPYLQRLKKLRRVYVCFPLSEDTFQELQAALPNCDLVYLN